MYWKPGILAPNFWKLISGASFSLRIIPVDSSNGWKRTGESVYNVSKLKEQMKIDAEWNKLQWKKIKAIDIINPMGDKPLFTPQVNAKMMYDDKNLYVIYLVRDKFVRCITEKINGPVWEDSCVEFFFSPDTAFPERYFNLEVNCGGTPLMHYNLIPRKESVLLDQDDIKEVEIAHSLPSRTDPEITEQITWTLEFRIPINILEKYSKVSNPGKGVTWRANFFKIADKTSNPHYLTWSSVNNHKPDFHLPEYFGWLRFT